MEPNNNTPSTMNTEELQRVCDMADNMQLGEWLDLMNATISEQTDPEAARRFCCDYNLRQFELKKLKAYGYSL